MYVRSDDEEKPGSTYKGGYKHGKKEGQGLAKFEDGGEYKGAWRNDEKSGLGAYYYPNGDSYIGHWKGDVKHGEGTYTFKSCKSIFTGQWAEGELRTYICFCLLHVRMSMIYCALYRKNG